VAVADIRLIRILEALKTKTRAGDISWSPVGLGYIYGGDTYSATIESDKAGGSGPYRFQIHDDTGSVSDELTESDDDPPGMESDWRDGLATLYSLAGRENPRQEQLLEEVARELGIT
jgi:hypothetical protein